MALFADRSSAGRALGAVLSERARYDLAGRSDVLVLGLPRGGMPVAAEVAAALDAPLDALVVRKLGVPGRPELAMGAVGPGGVLVHNEDVIAGAGVTAAAFAAAVERETAELSRREQVYRGGRRPAAVLDRVVLLVDDGLATGATMRAAVAVVRAAGARRVVVAVPVAPERTCEQLGATGTDVVCLRTPARFRGVAAFYADFRDPGDDVVRHLAEGG